MLKLTHSSQILVRETEDWGNLTNEEHLNNLHTICPINQFPLLHKNIEFWNKNYNLSYPLYRFNLNQLSITSWKNTGLHINNSICISRGYIVPTDDDDLFHPNIKDYLDEAFLNSNIKLVYWNSTAYFPSSSHTNSQNKTFVDNFEDDIGKYGSNSYAVDAKSPKSVLYDHGFARKEFGDLMPNNVLYIDKPLSLWIRHPGSRWSLEFFDLRNNNLSTFKIDNIPPKLEWATTYIKVISGLTKLLNV